MCSSMYSILGQQWLLKTGFINKVDLDSEPILTKTPKNRIDLQVQKSFALITPGIGSRFPRLSVTNPVLRH